jgi:Leucine-rich repeat (LRR) protein
MTTETTMSHDKSIPILKKRIEDGINGNGEVVFCFHYPLEITTEEGETQEYDYSASDIDEAFSAFTETELAKIMILEFSMSTIKKLPQSVRRLKNLTELLLIITDVRRWPKWVSELTHLKCVSIETYTKTLLKHFEPVLQLPALNELYIDSPHIDQIPLVISECTTLTEIYLRFGLNIVPLWLRNMRSLKRLHLGPAGFNALPEWFGELTTLESLSIKDSELLDLPSSFANLKSLKALVLDSNSLTELPDYIGTFTQLETLSVSGAGPDEDRELKVLPDWIGNLGVLSWLDLTHTQITTLPDTLAKCVSLKTLLLGMSAISEVPECIQHLPLLEKLDLGHTRISELPPWLENLSALKSLDINYTRIKDIPEYLLHRAEQGTLKLHAGRPYE